MLLVHNTRTKYPYSTLPKTEAAKFVWASDAKAQRVAAKRGVPGWGPCAGVCTGGRCRLAEPTSEAGCCRAAAPSGDDGYAELEADAADEARGAQLSEGADAFAMDAYDDGPATGSTLNSAGSASLAGHGRARAKAFVCWKAAHGHGKHGE
jgi:hypothetical protein